MIYLRATSPSGFMHASTCAATDEEADRFTRTMLAQGCTVVTQPIDQALKDRSNRVQPVALKGGWVMPPLVVATGPAAVDPAPDAPARAKPKKKEPMPSFFEGMNL